MEGVSVANEVNIVKVEDVKRFGNLLSGARVKINKSWERISREIKSKNANIKVSKPSVQNWENGQAFPVENEDNLRVIAEVYEIVFEDFIKDFRISKEARKKEKESKKKPKHNKVDYDNEYGLSSSRRIKPRQSLEDRDQ